MRKTKIIIGLLSIISISSISGICISIYIMNNNTLIYYPSLQWLDPNNGDLILFGPEDSQFDFQFTYNPNFIDRIELLLNNVSIANVTHKNKVELDYQASFDGQCNATLLGYKNGVAIENDTINLVFRKLIKDEMQMLDEGEENIGMRPFLIIHDSNGDQSYFTVTTNMYRAPKIRMGVNGTVKTEDGKEIDANFDFESFTYGPIGYGFDVEKGSQENMDLLYVKSDESGFRINSGHITDDPEGIGPGLGDHYFGSNWTLAWSFNCRNQTYFNGTEIYSDPFFSYGFKFSDGVMGINMINSQFPEEWKQYNPTLTGYSDEDVQWNYIADQLPAINSTNLLSNLINISISEQACSHFDEIGTNFTFEIASKMYDVYNTFHIEDDDGSDYINNRMGIDKTFGTLIFQNIDSATTDPYEYNTTDYVASEIGFPEIKLDTDGNGVSPTFNDEPKVKVEITDDDHISGAWIIFSIDGGTSWTEVALTEQSNNLGMWEGVIPFQTKGTTVLWYLKAIDYQGNLAEQMDEWGNYYSYTVVNSAPEVSLISPHGGQTYDPDDDILTIQWTSNDADNDTMTASLYYNNAGMGWILIDTNISSNSYEWDVSAFSSQYMSLKIIISDGGDTVEYETSSTFQII